MFWWSVLRKSKQKGFCRLSSGPAAATAAAVADSLGLPGAVVQSEAAKQASIAVESFEYVSKD